MKGGEIWVGGEAAGDVGEHMCGGKIVIGKDAAIVGRGAYGGEIRVDGDIGWLMKFWDDPTNKMKYKCKAQIFDHENRIWPSRNPIKRVYENIMKKDEITKKL